MSSGSKNMISTALCVGIDLGTTHSLVAVYKNATVSFCPQESSSPLCPSAVYYGVDLAEVVVGNRALQYLSTDQQHSVVTSSKRLIGRPYLDISRSDFFAHYPYLRDNYGMPVFDTLQGPKTPITVAADILFHLRKQACVMWGAVNQAVITVPAYFNDHQRQATRDAALLAGWQTLRLLNEPTAAAIAYNLSAYDIGCYLVYDLGGGTFDVTVLQASGDVFDVLSTTGRMNLGGDDFDRLLYNFLCDRHGIAMSHNTHTILHHVRALKEKLVMCAEIEYCLQDKHHPCMQGVITRQDFHTVTMSLVQETLHLVKKSLEMAKLTVHDICQVILVGGATRMQHIQRALQELFQTELLTSIDPDIVVAIGAARQGALLSGDHQDFLLLDVTPFSLGLEMYGGVVEKIVPRNSKIPLSCMQEFTTFQDNQTGLVIHVLQGERNLVESCCSLARFELTGLSPRPAGLVRVRVQFDIDVDGILTVSAMDVESHRTVSVKVQRPMQLSLAAGREVRMLVESSPEDEAGLWLQMQRVEAEKLLLSLDKSLKVGRKLLSDEKYLVIMEVVDRLRIAMRNDDAIVLQQLCYELNQCTQYFAHLYIQDMVDRYVLGSSIDALPDSHQSEPSQINDKE